MLELHNSDIDLGYRLIKFSYCVCHGFITQYVIFFYRFKTLLTVSFTGFNSVIVLCHRLYIDYASIKTKVI